MVIEMKDDKKVSLEELCRQLSISLATGKNWVKLGKIVPEYKIDDMIFFSQDYINNLLKDIGNAHNSVLKSRRNKKYVSGNKLYLSYVSSSSKNLLVVKSLIEYIQTYKIELDDSILATILVNCAKKMFIGAKLEGDFNYLLEDISSEFGKDETLYVNYPELSNLEFVYEENEDLLGLIYLSLKSLKARKYSGAYYTPTMVVKNLCSALFIDENLKNKSVIDPCCGSGNFILQLPELFSYRNVFASDIDLMSVLLARINFALKFKVLDKKILYSHVYQVDYLNAVSEREYDYIIGNPPWGYNFTDEQKAILKDKYHSAQGNNIESFDLVVEKAISELSLGGILSFVLPESFLNVKSHAIIREFLMKKCSIVYVEYLGDVFDGVQCPSVIIQIKNNNQPFTTKGMFVKKREKSFIIDSNRDIKVDCFNFQPDNKQYYLLKKFISAPNTFTLKGNAKFALGIVTGDNKSLISNKIEKGYEPIIKGSDVNKYTYQVSDNYIMFNPEKFQQVAPVELYRAKEKLFYKFISNKLVFAYDDKQTLSLNSCNILIPEVQGVSVKYILAVLNSSIAQFFYLNNFNSLKVLRSYIEQIPIPFADESVRNEVENIVDKILCANKQDSAFLIEKLDAMIASLYDISNEDYATLMDNII